MKNWYVVTLIFTAAFFACEIDHGLGTLDSGITGRVIFLNPQAKPEHIDAVRIVAVVNFPPQGLGDLVFTNSSINLSAAESEYRLPAPLAYYQLVGAIYREKGKDWDYANILGIYGFDPVQLEFEIKPVLLDRQNPVAKDINIYCDWALLLSPGLKKDES